MIKRWHEAGENSNHSLDKLIAKVIGEVTGRKKRQDTPGKIAERVVGIVDNAALEIKAILKQDHSQMPEPKRRRLVKKLTGLIDDASKLRDIIYKID